MWVGTALGSSRYTQTTTDGDGTWSSYAAPPFHDQQITAMRVNAVDNKIWFGTDSGLTVFSDTVWSRFTSENSPLPNDTVTSLAHDARGNLWIGTRQGVAVYNPSGTILK